MGRYDDVVEEIEKQIEQNPSPTPRETWNEAIGKVFRHSPSSRAQGCPRDTFLSSCEMGVVEDVPEGTYTRSEKNEEYVTRALRTLREAPTLVDDRAGLWEIATDGANIQPNSQMDVLVALRRRGMIRDEPR